MRRFSLVALSLLILGATLAPTAGAANITVGADLGEAYLPVPSSEPYTVVNTSVSGLGANAVSPVSGLIVAWSMYDNTIGAEYRLRVMTPVGLGKYLITGSSSVGRPPGAYEATFATALPIAAGQTIGLDLGEFASIGVVNPLLGAGYLGWNPVPGEGLTPSPSYGASETEYAFNAEIQPAPTIESIGAATGPTAGGTAVTISGADLEGVTAVKFGSTAATFIAKSAAEIDATAPPSANGGPVAITVTTNAGTGTAPQQFTYQAPAGSGPLPVGPPPPTCKVPDLKGKNLRASKRRIRGADCKVGTVTKKKGVTAKSGKVVNQNPKPGKLLAAGTKIKVVLGG